MFSRSALFALLLTTFFLTSCAPVRPKLVGEKVSRTFADGLMHEWYESSSLVTSVQGLAKVKAHSPERSLSGTQVLLAEKPDRLRAETLSPFGSPLLLLTADGEKLSVSIPSRNVYYTGAATPANLGQFVHIPLRLTDLVSVLLYQPPMIDARKEEAFTLQEGGWLLVRHGTLRRQELVFNPMRQLVEVSYFADNDMIIKIEYAKFSDQGNRFPRQFSLELPERKTTVSLEFSDLETNGKLRSGVFLLPPPPGARVVYLPDE